MSPIASEDQKKAVEHEVALLGLNPEHLEVRRFGALEWGVTLRIQGRTFELSWFHQDGWCCSENTQGRMKRFVLPDSQIVLRDHGYLLKQGLATVRYAVNHPEFGGATRPVI